MNYDVRHIIKLSEIDHIRENPGMYVGSTENPTSLLFELFDNAVDEALAGYASVIGVFINNKKGEIEVWDNGRGYPFDENLPLKDDPPVLTCTRLFTSGKFRKGTNDTAYKIATGLHGIGNVAVYALSKSMRIDIYRDGKYAIYKFNGKGVSRYVEEFRGKSDYSTKIVARINKKYFSDIRIDVKRVEERVRLAVANHPDLKVILRVDNENIIIKGTEEDLILDYLSKTVEDWYIIDDHNKKSKENYHLRIGWEPSGFGPPRILSCVNLVRTDGGIHINKFYNVLRNVFQNFAKKYGYNFNNDDCLQGLRSYLSLEIVNTSFNAQVKTILEKNSDICIMNNLEKKLKVVLEENGELLINLIDRFQTYRQTLRSKKVMKGRLGRARATTKFTKLRDCSELGGELIIGEGDSALSGVADFRDSRKHAILPLRGVIPNALTMNPKKLLANNEISDIIQAIGCGIGTECDISNLRYNKIIIATDSDPAGHWIAALLIILFAKLVPDVIKNGYLFLCKTPLFATRRKGKFIPLWTKEQLDKAREKGEKVKRYKGLGEYDPEDIKIFILDESTRILVPVTWPVRESNVEDIFELFTSSRRKRQLVSGEWKLKGD